MHRSRSKILRAIANAPVRNKSYCTYRLQHPLRDVIHERINKHHNKLEAHLNPLLEPLRQPVKRSLYWAFFGTAAL
jgi:hypothetical protein